ncbi:uncharacterized protein LOC122257359 [Penaeus japonicus]|uniref:uncharacterized protein LOC122257359 n=1 Tax=Penaeus japonicus TaxID=27405 RepID=UPI001C710158|nr:uncharacterized protein LOC122257359 [Penaeus japonicus]
MPRHQALYKRSKPKVKLHCTMELLKPVYFLFFLGLVSANPSRSVTAREALPPQSANDVTKNLLCIGRFIRLEDLASVEGLASRGADIIEDVTDLIHTVIQPEQVREMSQDSDDPIITSTVQAASAIVQLTQSLDRLVKPYVE